MATLTSEFQYLSRSQAIISMDGKLKYYVLLYAKTKADTNTGVHTVTIREVLASPTSGATFYQWYTSFSGKINNVTAFSGTNKPWSAWELPDFTVGGVTYKEGTVIAEGSVDVDCSNGLAKDIPLSCTWTFTSEDVASYTPVPNSPRTASATVTLPAIPRRAELVTAPNFSDEDSPTITYSNPAGTAVESLEVGIYDDAGYTAYVPYRSVNETGTSYTFKFTEAERDALCSAVEQGDSISVKFYIRTRINGSVYLAQPLTRTFTIANAKPVVKGSISCDDRTYALTGSRTTLIKYFSDVTATMSITPQKGATIAEDYCLIRNGAQTGWGEEYLFNKVESDVFTFSAEDDRGNIGEDTVTATMVDYTKLTCSIGNNRPDALGNMTLTCAGDYYPLFFGKEYNTLTVQYRYMGGGTQSDWADMTISHPSINRYTGYADFVIPDFDQNAYYTFEVKAWDEVSTVTGEPLVVKSIPVFHWGENDFVFEVPVTFNAGASDPAEGDKTIKGNLNVTGDLRLKGSGNYGNTLRFGDGNYAYISEPEDDCLVIKASSIDIQSDNVMINGDAFGGSDEVISVGTTAMGTNGTWYWRKWRSGRAECYGKRNYGNMAINTAWGSLSTSEDFSQSLPSGLFVSAPEVVQINIVSTDKAAWILQGYTAGSTAVVPSATTTGTFSVVRPAAVTLSQVYLGFNIIGRWK